MYAISNFILQSFNLFLLCPYFINVHGINPSSPDRESSDEDSYFFCMFDYNVIAINKTP